MNAANCSAATLVTAGWQQQHSTDSVVVCLAVRRIENEQSKLLLNSMSIIKTLVAENNEQSAFGKHIMEKMAENLLPLKHLGTVLYYSCYSVVPVGKGYNIRLKYICRMNNI